MPPLGDIDTLVNKRLSSARLIFILSAVAAGTGIAAAEPHEQPAITGDGSKIIVPYVDKDGARGSPNLTLFVADRRGVITKRIDVVDVEAGPVPGGERAMAKLYAETKPRAMKLLSPANPNELDTHRIYVGLTVDLSESGTLSIRPKGHSVIRRSNTRWRTEPTANSQAALRKMMVDEELPCFNPAGIGSVWIDVKRRAMVVYVRYHGNDSCWEPSSEFVVVAW